MRAGGKLQAVRIVEEPGRNPRLKSKQWFSHVHRFRVLNELLGLRTGSGFRNSMLGSSKFQAPQYWGVPF